MSRTVFAIVFGALSLLIICDTSAGYLHMGKAPALGTLVLVDNAHEAFRSVTPQGRAAGIMPGDVLSKRDMDLERFYVQHPNGEAGDVYPLSLERDGKMVQARVVLQPQPTTFLGAVDIVMRFLLAAAGILLLARGVGRDSLWAGIFVCSLAVGEGFERHYWGGPVVALAMSFAIFSIFWFGMWACRLLFAFALLPKSVPAWLRWSLIALGCAGCIPLFSETLVLLGVRVFSLPVEVNTTVFFIGEWVVGAVAVATFGVAAIYADGQKARAIGWIFGAMLISQLGPWINFAYSFNGLAYPFNGLLNVTYLALAIVLPYAALSQRLLTVNFVVSRALVYTLVLTTIVGTFIVLEKIVENAAIGRLPSQAFELIVAVGLGLSFKWIEGWAERIVERVLYRRKVRAEQELNALVEDFPHARDVSGLATRVAREVCRQMQAPFVAVYRESELTYSPIAVAGGAEPLPVDADDPVFLRLRSKHAVLHTDDFTTGLSRHSVVFPLVVFGSVTGALVVQTRESSEAYDPDELETLKRVAHELAIALLWVERIEAPLRALPAV